MVRIARIIARLNRGGPARTFLATEPTLAMRGLRTLVIAGHAPPHEDDLAEEFRQAGIEVVELKSLVRRPSPWKDRQARRELRIVLDRFQPDLIHSHTFKAGLLARRLPPQYGPRIHTFHGHVFEGYFSRWTSRALVHLERYLARKTDRLVTVSPTTKTDLVERYGIAPASQIEVIPGIVQPPRPGPLPSIPAMPTPEDPWIGCVGRMTAIKNPALFVDVAAAVLQVQPRVHFVWVGDGELKPWFVAEVQRRGLADRVHCVGWQQNPSPWQQRFAVTVLLSRNEGLPLSLLEAKACGSPVVATAVGGVSDLIRDGIDGCTVPQQTGVIRDAIVRYLQSPELARTHGHAGRDHVLEHYSVAAYVERLTDLYRRVLRDAGCSLTGPYRDKNSHCHALGRSQEASC